MRASCYLGNIMGRLLNGLLEMCAMMSTKCWSRARTDKLVGALLDAAAYIHCSDDDKRKILQSLVGDTSLISPPVKTNGVDKLRTVLMLLQVNLVDSKDEIASSCDEKYISLSDTTSGSARLA